MPYEKVKKDSFDLIPFLSNIELTEPFTKKDCLATLECFDERYCTFPIEDISRLSEVPILRNRRNGRKQLLHLKMARAIMD